jgi:hypothetical protein
MGEMKEKQHKALLERFGSEEAIKEWRRENQRKSRETYKANGAKGGIRALTPEQHKAMSDKGRASRWGNREKAN